MKSVRLSTHSTSFGLLRLATRLGRTAAALALTCFLLPTSLSHAAGGDLIWTFQGIEDINAIDEIEDQDADGTPDVLVETYDAGATGDHLYCLSGAAPGPNAVTIWSVKPVGGPSNSGSWGDDCLSTTLDLSSDGIADVLLGTAWGGRTAYALDGTDGSILWSFDTYVGTPPNPAESGWVYTMSAVPDVNADLVPDVFFGVGSDNNRAYHLSGKTGDVLWSQNLGDAIFDSAPLQDVSGDGIADVAMGVGDNADAVWALRGGATVTPTIWNRPMSGSVQGLVSIQDLSGDGINDVIAGHWGPAVIAINGVTGATIWSVAVSSPVMQLAVLDDVDGDGKQDIAVGSWADRAFVLSGDDGTEAWSFPTSGDVWTVSRLADVTGDGINDVVAGSFDQNVYALDGVTGAQLWSFATGNRLYFVKGLSDVTGNSIPDVAAGTQFLSAGGRAYLLEGGDPPTPVDDDPTFVSVLEIASGVQATVTGAGNFHEAYLERHEGTPNARAEVSRFRESVFADYQAGRLSTKETIAARTQDPGVRWSRVGTGVVRIQGGQAVAIDPGAEAGHSYTYRFAFVSAGSVVSYSRTATITVSGNPTVAIPRLRVQPNPAFGEVTVQFVAPSAQRLTLEVIDTAGRRVASRADRALGAGPVLLSWDGRNESGQPVPAGIYFVRVVGRDFVSTEKVTRLR